MSNLRAGGRKLSQGQKIRLRQQQEKAIQTALIEQGKYYQQQLPTPVIAATPAQSNSLVVPDWRRGWTWFSNISFALIVAVQAFYEALPPELLATLPTDTQEIITVVLSVMGIAGRFLNQSRTRKKDDAHV